MNNTEEQHSLTRQPSVLASLRALTPERQLAFLEALQIAELQANRLLELSGVHDAPVPSDIVTTQPRVRLERRRIPTSGLSYWDGQVWVVCLNSREPVTRQRFTLLHEYKHIVDHGAAQRLYPGSARHSAEEEAEQAADYFAGCVLMPKRLVKRVWGEGRQRPEQLARAFGVSERAIEVRVAQLGPSEPTRRCTPPSAKDFPPGRRATYHRNLSAGWPHSGVERFQPIHQPEEAVHA